MPAGERLESKQLLNAILLGNDSGQLKQSPTATPPVELRVLDNDFSPSGGLTITSVQSPAHGSASIVSADPNDP